MDARLHGKSQSLPQDVIKPGNFPRASTLALGVLTRLAYVAVAIALLWLGVWWALR